MLCGWIPFRWLVIQLSFFFEFRKISSSVTFVGWFRTAKATKTTTHKYIYIYRLKCVWFVHKWCEWQKAIRKLICAVDATSIYRSHFYQLLFYWFCIVFSFVRRAIIRFFFELNLNEERWKRKIIILLMAIVLFLIKVNRRRRKKSK